MHFPLMVSPLLVMGKFFVDDLMVVVSLLFAVLLLMGYLLIEFMLVLVGHCLPLVLLLEDVQD